MISITPPENTIAYFKNQLGEVESTKTNNRTNPILSGYSTITSLAMPNEAGCFNPNRFGAGKYEISYLFKLHPPVEVDEKYSHLNLKLLDEHLPYRNMEVTIHDPRGLIEQLFTHPPMPSKKVGDAWIITSSSPENSLLEVEMLLKPVASRVIRGFPRIVSDVEGQTLSANSAYSGNNALASNLFNGLRALVLLFPLLLLLIYYRFGKEKSYIVPKTLSYVPSKIKPWVVNLVFKGDAFDFDQDGFYATLLDLSRRGVLELESEPSLRIKLLKDATAAEDSYESKVLSFLEFHSSNEVFVADDFEDRVKDLRNNRPEDLYEIRKTMNRLLKVADKKVSMQFVSSGRWKMAGLMGLFLTVAGLVSALALISGSIYPSLYQTALISLILLAQSVLPVFAPSALYGRWKSDYYKEKLEWEAFGNFLSDYAMVQKYAPEDINIWKEWLVYGTALGVGKKVSEAMKQLNIHIPEALAVTYMSVYFNNVYGLTTPPSTGSGPGWWRRRFWRRWRIWWRWRWCKVNPYLHHLPGAKVINLYYSVIFRRKRDDQAHSTIQVQGFC